MATSGPEGLEGMRILIVEDEFYLADDLAKALGGRGAEIVGPVGSLAKAEAALQDAAVDCAILDMNLRGRMSYPIADRLQAAGIPFVVASGYSRDSMPDRFKDARHIEKPFGTSAVVEAVADVLQASKPH